jgi:hypothetical protein
MIHHLRNITMAGISGVMSLASTIILLTYAVGLIAGRWQ